MHAVVREHYLRPAAEFASPPPLPAGLCWILPDTNAVLHQFDLLASADLPHPLLVAQTVLDEVRHRSLPLYNKLRTLVDDDFQPSASTSKTGKMKRGWTVWNEALEETFLEKNDGESPNDRNDRAIRHLAAYYSAILSPSAGGGASNSNSNKRPKLSDAAAGTVDLSDAPVILLTDDAANLALARKASLRALTAKEYVASLPSDVQNSLVDLLAVGGSGLDRDGTSFGGKRKGAALYAEHLPTSVLQAGVKAGKYIQGHFNPSQYNFREVRLFSAYSPDTPKHTQVLTDSRSQATVNAASLPKPVLLAGLESMNRAVAGDLVVVEVLPENEWKSLGEEVVDEDGEPRE